MQNSINIPRIPPPTNAHSRKRNSTCKPHSHGRRQPPPSPPSPPLHGSQTHTHGSWHVRKVEGAQRCPKISGKYHKNRCEMSSSPTSPPMHKTQNNKRNTTQNLRSHGRHQTPPIPPSPPTHRAERETGHASPRSPPLPTPAVRSNTNGSPSWHVRKEARHSAARKFWESTAKTDAKCETHRKTQQKTMRNEQLRNFLSGNWQCFF